MVIGFVRSHRKGARVPPSEEIRAAVSALSADAGIEFRVSEKPVPGTEMYIVFAENHPLPEHYTPAAASLGFRVPGTFPDAGPEDCFFLHPAEIALRIPDPVRNSTEINRAGVDPNIANGVLDGPVRNFSWHLWNKTAWKRQTHTLIDHYRHVLRRFEVPEHD